MPGQRGAPKLTAKIRQPLRGSADRRTPPVDEADPARVRLVSVCLLRDADPEPLALRVCQERGEPCQAGEAPPAWAVAEARKRLRDDWDRACGAFVADNMGLAIAFARQMAARHVPEEDVVQACAVGLLRAIREFDPERAGRFSTFAVWKMRHEANTLIRRQEGAIVPQPGQLIDDRWALEEEARRLSAVLGRAPDDAALLAALREREVRRNEEARQAEERKAAQERREPRPLAESRRWRAATEARVREVRESYVGFGHRSVDSRPDDARGRGSEALQRALKGPDDAPPEVKIQVRRAFAKLPPVLRAVVADELGVDLPGGDDAEVPSCPVARQIALGLAVDRLRALLRDR